MYGKTISTKLGLAGLLAVVAMVVMAMSASAAFGFSEFKSTFPNKFHGTGGLATFLGEKGTIVMCNKSLSTGEVTSAELATKIVITYSGDCLLQKAPIENGAACGTSETITTEELKASPATISGGSNRGLLLLPARGTALAKFKCGGASITVKGAILCEDEPNTGKPGLTGKIVCADGSKVGEQKFTSGEVLGSTVSNVSLTAEATDIFTITEKDAQATEETVTYENSIEQT